LDCRTSVIAIRFLRAKTREQRAAVDLDTHHSKEYVKYIPATVCSQLRDLEARKMHVGHKMSIRAFDSIRAAGFPVSILHG
ncbi:Hypothetical predicted protein, partial [Olea europaea subsp. europaea]